MRVAAGKSSNKGTGGKEIVRRWVIFPLRYASHFTDSVVTFSELNKVLTNGTLVDAEMLTDEQAGHCISIRVTYFSTRRKSIPINEYAIQ